MGRPNVTNGSTRTENIELSIEKRDLCVKAGYVCSTKNLAKIHFFLRLLN